ncbi:syntaxin [Acrasis kona]|uniref:Syntaxin n=1 Tax=Acrasis kona TaxID=1008807 RepID=A0AAW2Z0P8_9EUKA
MNNRLKEFNKYREEDEDDEFETPPDDEVGIALREHQEEVRKIESSMKDVNSYLSKLEKSHKKSIGAVTQEEQTKYDKEISEHNKKISLDVKNIKTYLEEMSGVVKEEKKKEGNSAFVRIAEIHHTNLSRDFANLVKAYQKMQEKHQFEKKKRMKRSIQLVKSDMTEEEIDELCDDPNMNPQNLFKTELKLTSTQKDTLNAELALAIETHAAIQELSRGMAEIHQLFVDFSTILAEQDQLIDNIADNVHKANEYIEKGTKNLKQAKNMTVTKQITKRCIVS